MTRGERDTIYALLIVFGVILSVVLFGNGATFVSFLLFFLVIGFIIWHLAAHRRPNLSSRTKNVLRVVLLIVFVAAVAADLPRILARWG